MACLVKVTMFGVVGGVCSGDGLGVVGGVCSGDELGVVGGVCLDGENVLEGGVPVFGFKSGKLLKIRSLSRG